MLRRAIFLVTATAITVSLLALSAGAALAQAPAGQCQINVNGTTYTADAATCAQIANSVLDMVRGILGGLFLIP